MTGTDAKVLKAKFSLNWTVPYKALAVGPCTPDDTPDSSSLGDKVLHLGLPSDISGADARRLVSVQRCNPVPTPTTEATCRRICQRD